MACELGVRVRVRRELFLNWAHSLLARRVDLIVQQSSARFIGVVCEGSVFKIPQRSGLHWTDFRGHVKPSFAHIFINM